MKNFTCLILLAISLDTLAQELKIDPETQRYTFTQVISAEGKTKDQLFNIIKEWIALNYKSANSVIQSADKETGNIILKGSFVVNEGIRFTGDIPHTLILHFKDDKMKFEATNFSFRAERASTGYPFEGNWATGKKGLQKLIDRSEEFCKESVVSMEKYIITAKKKDDW